MSEGGDPGLLNYCKGELGPKRPEAARWKPPDGRLKMKSKTRSPGEVPFSTPFLVGRVPLRK